MVSKGDSSKGDKKGGDPSSDESASACPICRRSFGFFLWKHTCSVCKATVCDDCAPVMSSAQREAMPNPDILRICTTCAGGHPSGTHQGHRLGGGTSAAAGGPKPSVSSVDAQSETEREKRARIIEERMKVQQNRGRSSQLAVPSSSPANLYNPGTPQATATPPPPPQQQQQMPSVSQARGEAPPTSSASTAFSSSSNPALEAAMRRQQQQGGSKPSTGGNTSAEKVRLLHEIESILQQRGEATPFGLRSSDEAKLRSYLKYLKDKYSTSTA